jgi:hypothetical protein
MHCQLPDPTRRLPLRFSDCPTSGMAIHLSNRHVFHASAPDKTSVAPILNLIVELPRFDEHLMSSRGCETDSESRSSLLIRVFFATELIKSNHIVGSLDSRERSNLIQ